ncbi:MAG TPA: putative peptidoglycan glycosyltransferase FtsW [Opitutaceae bacterium]|nr:putative peptidoglycan glycosyltransferase FtsW [Opitutaceae bacterium]
MARDPLAETLRPRFIPSPVAVIVVCAVALTIFGLTVLFSASASFRQGPYFYLHKQIIGVVLAAVLCFVTSRLDLEFVRRYAFWIGAAALLLLLLTATPHIGAKVNGSRRWLGMGAARFQPAEFAKIALVFLLAHYLAINQSRLNEFRRGYLAPLAIIGAFCLLVIAEPDFGTTALLGAVGLVLLFLAGVRWRYLLPTALVGLGGLAGLVALLPNRAHRFMAFLDVEANRSGLTYQLWQGMLAFASGGLDGVGLGRGRQQLNFLPEAQTDFIFAVIGEEFGLWFTLGVVVLFAVIFVAGLLHLRRAPNLFQFLLVAGCILLICLQAIINLTVVTGMFPTKGMSLPFISAGLSNLLLMGLLLGVLLNSQRTWGRAAVPTGTRVLQEVTA